MKKICTVIGARPQFIKASPLSQTLRYHFNEILVHTGQHYDNEMSDIFFEELLIPKPKYNLKIGSGSHAKQTAAMLAGIEEVLIKEKPDIVLVYGDTNSSLAGALAAVKLHTPVAHVEAGLRSNNKRMPEEINRILIDHVSNWLFVPSEVSSHNLENEGLTQNVHVVGDIMLDSMMLHSKYAEERSNILEKLTIIPKSYCLATIHRPENTDFLNRMQNIFKAFSLLGKQIILPLHPRTRKIISNNDIHIPKNVNCCEPLGYYDIILLMKNADCILTDSGGMQKEAYYLSTPCVTLRDETEWTETVDAGWNAVVGDSTTEIVEAAQKSDVVRELPRPNLYGDGKTSIKITEILKGNVYE